MGSEKADKRGKQNKKGRGGKLLGDKRPQDEPSS